MFGDESTDDLFIAVNAGQLGNGLDEQLNRFVNEHTNTKLIIIDTLQKVREFGGDKYSYSNDYEVITRLKKFADNFGVCLLLVHHTRKQQADDKFDMISGTNGLLGAADGAFMLQKEKRTSNNAVLEISGKAVVGFGKVRNGVMERTTRADIGSGCKVYNLQQSAMVGKSYRACRKITG